MLLTAPLLGDVELGAAVGGAVVDPAGRAGELLALEAPFTHVDAGVALRTRRAQVRSAPLRVGGVSE